MMSLKPNLQKALGFAPPSDGAHAMHMAQQMQEEIGVRRLEKPVY